MDVVTLRKQRYAIGLWWQLGQGDKAMLSQARALSKSMGARYNKVLLRQGQFGLGSGGRAVHGLPSLAATLAQTGDSRLLLCPLPNQRWWVCGIKEGRIAAEGDWLGGSESEALAHAAHLRQMLDLPESQVLTGTEPLAAMLEVQGRARSLTALWGQNRVQNVSSPWRTVRIFGSMVLALLALFMSYSAGLFSDDDLLRLQLEARRMFMLTHPERFFPRPWVEKPSVMDWSARCATALLAVPFSEQGWELEDALCAENKLEVRWAYTPSASFLHLPQGAELLTPTIAQRVTTFGTLPRGKEQTLLSQDQVARSLYEISRLLGLHLTLHWKTKAQKTVTEGSISVPLTAPWHQGSFTIENIPSMLMMDKDFYEAFQSVPGLVLESMSYEKGIWKIKGLCHGT